MKFLILATVMALSIAGCSSVESSTSQTNPENTSISRKKTPIHIQSSSISPQNKKKLAKLCPGMSRQKVLAIMGTSPGISTKGMFKNPYRIEKHRSNRHVLELLFYCTDISKQGKFITDTELTPLVLMDGKLDGWGWQYWNKLVLLLQKYEGGLKPYLPPKGNKIKNTEKKAGSTLNSSRLTPAKKSVESIK